MRIGTLFSGIGAPEQAIGRVHPEHEIVFACEWDKFARQSYEANYDIEPEHFHKDINDMNGGGYNGEVDMIIGGSPCQDFSIAGLRAGVDGHRGQLIWQYFRIIDEVRPPVFIYENVKGMVSDKGGKTLKDFLEIFRSIGYHCHAEVLNTKDYGVPQNRERIYIIGFLDHNHYHRFEYAPKVKLEKRLKDVLEDDVDEKYYLSDKAIKYMDRDIGDGRTNWDLGLHYDASKEVGSAVIANMGKGVPYGVLKPEVSVIGKLDIKGDDYIKRVYDTDGLCPTIPTCQGGLQEPKIIQKPRGYNEGGEHGISPTLSSNSWQENNHLLAEKRIRRLTPRECLRLQDFSDSFVQVVSDSQQYKQAGNSMSANILEMLFRQTHKAQSDEPTGTLLDFS